jgi:hypothetical protein
MAAKGHVKAAMTTMIAATFIALIPKTRANIRDLPEPVQQSLDLAQSAPKSAMDRPHACC